MPLASFGEEGVCIYQNGEIIAYETSDRREADGGMYTSIATGEVLGSFCVDENNAYYYCTDQKVIREAEGRESACIEWIRIMMSLPPAAIPCSF